MRTPVAAASCLGLSLLWGSAARAAPTEPSAVTWRGYVQTDYVRTQQSEDQLADGTGLPLNEDRFLVRRARLIASGASPRSSAGLELVYVIEGDFNTRDGARAGMRQIEGALQWTASAETLPELPLTLRFGAGVIPTPFGYEVYEQRDAERWFTERSLMGRAFVPGQLDLGARLGAALDWSAAEPGTRLALDVAVLNGEPLGSASLPGGDPNAAKDVAARATAAVPLSRRARLEFGVSGLSGTGFHAGATPSEQSLVWRDFNEDGIVQLGELQAIAAASGTPSQNFDRWGLGGELRSIIDWPELGRLTLSLEAALAVNLDRAVRPADPVFLGRDQRAVGLAAAVTQELGPHAVIGFRFDFYRPEIDRTELRGGTLVRSREEFMTYTGLAGTRLKLGTVEGRLIAEYAVQRDPLGRDASGRPADLRNDTLTARAQVSF
jgi:hypothetical protein